jgi:ATP-dependent RNA helicase DeaD
VASLVRATRAAMPAPEDLVDNEPEPQSGFGARPQARAGFEDTVWFRIDIGRNKNAEARWLLPMICRRGHLTKSDIGAIRVFDRETRFEIVRAAVDRFTAAIAKGEDDGMHIELLAEPDLPAARDRGPRKPQGARPPRSNAAHPRDGGDAAEARGPRGPKPDFRPRDGERNEKPWKNKPERSDERVEKPWKSKPEAAGAGEPAADKPWKTRPRPEGAAEPAEKPWKPKADAAAGKPQTSKKQSAKLGGAKPFKGGGKKSNGKSRWDA